MNEILYCSNCGRENAQHMRPYRDVCPTDRGDEVREGWEPICGECLGEVSEHGEQD